MKANELRIGNYFNVPIKEQSPFRIDAFEYASDTFVKVAQHQTINGTEVHPLTWYGKDLTPIPLTEEWLLKFGFVEKIDAYFYNDYCIEDIHNGVTWVISEFDHITDEFTAIGCGIKYVHQLQNLYFALTGEELTFKSE